MLHVMCLRVTITKILRLVCPLVKHVTLYFKHYNSSYLYNKNLGYTYGYMNDAQNPFSTGGSDLSQTRNPQTNEAQNLGAPESNLQTTNGSVLSETNLTITSVGSSPLDTVNVKAASTTTASNATNNTSSTNYLLIGMAVVLFIFALLIFLAIAKSGQHTNKAK